MSFVPACYSAGSRQMPATTSRQKLKSSHTPALTARLAAGPVQLGWSAPPSAACLSPAAVCLGAATALCPVRALQPVADPEHCRGMPAAAGWRRHLAFVELGRGRTRRHARELGEHGPQGFSAGHGLPAGLVRLSVAADLPIDSARFSSRALPVCSFRATGSRNFRVRRNTVPRRSLSLRPRHVGRWRSFSWNTWGNRNG
jgi:hypothetical protein